MDELADRAARVHRLIEDEPEAEDAPAGIVGHLQRLGLALARALPATHAGVSLLTEDHDGGGTAASDPASLWLEELQFGLGEGPGIEAFATRRPVLVSDLAGEGQRRWPSFAPAAHEQGVRAVYAFPLQVGAARFGSLDIYRDKPGSLSTTALRDAFTFAHAAVSVLLDGQHAGADGLGATGSAATGLDDVVDTRLEIYQAQGMVMVDLGVSLTEAMARLRGHANAQNQSLANVARDVVAGSLILGRDTA